MCANQQPSLSGLATAAAARSANDMNEGTDEVILVLNQSFVKKKIKCQKACMITPSTTVNKNFYVFPKLVPRNTCGFLVWYVYQWIWHLFWCCPGSNGLMCGWKRRLLRFYFRRRNIAKRLQKDRVRLQNRTGSCSPVRGTVLKKQQYCKICTYFVKFC